MVSISPNVSPHPVEEVVDLVGTGSGYADPVGRGGDAAPVGPCQDVFLAVIGGGAPYLVVPLIAVVEGPLEHLDPAVLGRALSETQVPGASGFQEQAACGEAASLGRDRESVFGDPGAPVDHPSED